MDVQGFFIRYLLLPLFAIVAAILLVLKNKNQRFCSNKKLITFLLLLGLVLGLPGMLGLLQMNYMPWGYTLSVIYNFIIGSIVVYVLATRYEYELDTQKIYIGFFYLVAIMLGFYIHLLLFERFSTREMGFWAATSTCNFILPLFLWWSYRALLSVPAEIYKVWQYPQKPLQLELDALDFNRMLVLELEIFKSVTDREPIRVKVKAPAEMNFGDWFYKFIEDYNLKFPNNPVSFNDQERRPFLWIFFIKNAFFKRNSFIDPDLNIRQNGITEKMTIYAKRVSVNEAKMRAQDDDESIFI